MGLSLTHTHTRSMYRIRSKQWSHLVSQVDARVDELVGLDHVRRRPRVDQVEQRAGLAGVHGLRDGFLRLRSAFRRRILLILPLPGLALGGDRVSCREMMSNAGGEPAVRRCGGMGGEEGVRSKAKR